jgi:hypothetical protein
MEALPPDQAAPSWQMVQAQAMKSKAFNIWEITAVVISKYLPSKRIVSANIKTAMQTMAETMGFIMPFLRTALEKS